MTADPTDPGAITARLPFVAETSIGHARMADALMHGMAATVRTSCAALAAR